MTLDDLPLLSMLKGRLGYLADRQKLIAQNVANADTPGFMPKDLKPFSTQTLGPAQLAMIAPAETSPMHMSGRSRTATRNKAVDTPDSETTLNGNSVVLEEEMMKMSQARSDYDAAVGFYQKSLALLQLAVKRPGQ